ESIKPRGLALRLLGLHSTRPTSNAGAGCGKLLKGATITSSNKNKATERMEAKMCSQRTPNREQHHHTKRRTGFFTAPVCSQTGSRINVLLQTRNRPS